LSGYALDGHLALLCGRRLALAETTGGGHYGLALKFFDWPGNFAAEASSRCLDVKPGPEIKI
jgi:hypothetical protein